MSDTQLQAALIDVRSKINKALRLKAALYDGWVGLPEELQWEANRLFRLYAREEERARGISLADWRVEVEIKQNDKHDTKWAIWIVTRSAIDRLADLA